MAVLWLNNHDILIKTNLLSESQTANVINAGVRSRRPPRHKLSMQMSAQNWNEERFQKNECVVPKALRGVRAQQSRHNKDTTQHISPYTIFFQSRSNFHFASSSSCFLCSLFPWHASEIIQMQNTNRVFLFP